MSEPTRWERTGECRVPKVGEWYEASFRKDEDAVVLQCSRPCELKRFIVRPIAPLPEPELGVEKVRWFRKTGWDHSWGWWELRDGKLYGYSGIGTLCSTHTHGEAGGCCPDLDAIIATGNCPDETWEQLPSQPALLSPIPTERLAELQAENERLTAERDRYRQRYCDMRKQLHDLSETHMNNGV